LIAELLKADEPDPAAAPVAHDDGSPGEDQARFTLEGLLAFKKSADLLVKGKSQEKLRNTGSHSMVRNWLVSFSFRRLFAKNRFRQDVMHILIGSSSITFMRKAAQLQ